MRRGNLSNINLFLIVVVAIFTLISYLTDQLVIRNEDNLRDLNIKYNNTKVRLEHLNSTSESLGSMAMRGQGIVDSYLVKRHIWIKTLILTENDKKYAEFFKKRKLNYKRDLKFNLIDDYRGVLLGVQSIRNEFQHTMAWLEDSIQKDVEKKVEENSKWFDLFYFDKVFESNIDEFFFKDDELYYDANILSALKEDHENLVNKLEHKQWVDLNRYTILCLEKFYKDIRHLDDFYYKYFEKLIEEQDDILETTFNKRRKISNKKNRYILISILTQILALLFLLFLFRNMIKDK